MVIFVDIVESMQARRRTLKVVLALLCVTRSYGEVAAMTHNAMLLVYKKDRQKVLVGFAWQLKTLTTLVFVVTLAKKVTNMFMLHWILSVEGADVKLNAINLHKKIAL